MAERVDRRHSVALAIALATGGAHLAVIDLVLAPRLATASRGRVVTPASGPAHRAPAAMAGATQQRAAVADTPGAAPSNRVLAAAAPPAAATGAPSAVPAASPASAPARDEGLAPLIVYFERRRSDLSPAACEALAALATRLHAEREARVLVRGHADELGDDARNDELSALRAAVVSDFLRGRGVGGHRMRTEALGEREPAVPGHDPGAWAQNRRVEVIPRRARPAPR